MIVMNSLMHWLNMGGYAAYVWPSYGLVVIVFMSLFLGSRWHGLRTRKQLRRWFQVS